MMPKVDGLEVCRQLRADPSFPFTPIIMVTAKADPKDVVAGLEAGGDEYLTKPVDQVALVARVKSMLRIKELHDSVEAMAAKLAELEPDARAARRGPGGPARPPLAIEALLLPAARRADRGRGRRGSPGDPPARGDRRLPRPPRLHGVRRDRRAGGGHGRPPRVPRRDGRPDPRPRGHAGALRRGRHDGLLQRPRAGPGRAGACRPDGARDARPARELGARWRKRGYELDIGIGIAQGFATIGAIGFEGRLDYGAIGTVTNLAARLCGEAKPGQILVSQRLLGAVEALAEAEPVGELPFKGFSKPMPTFNVVGLRALEPGTASGG